MRKHSASPVIGHRKSIGWAASLAVLACGIQPAAAQVADENAATEIDEIIVTARLREESLIEVPLAITAFSGAEIERLGITDVVDISLLTPGFAMQNNSRQNEQPFIRGASANSFFRDNQTASFFHDGVFVGGVARTIGIDDIQQVEVVKGPQAVYFGRQTFAGAVNYIPKRPSFDGLDVHGRAEVGENERYRLSGGISAPIVEDTLAARLYLQYGSYDGGYANSQDDFRVQTEDTLGGSASVTWRPTANSEIRARAQITEFEDGNNAVALVGSDQLTCLPDARGRNRAFCGEIPTPDGINLNLATLEFPGGLRKVDQERYSLHADFEFDAFNLQLISAYNTEDSINASDGDGLPVNRANFTFRSTYEDTTQQVVLTSKDDQRLRWTAGGLYFWSDRTESSVTFPFSSPSDPRVIENIALFGQLDFDVSDAVTLGVGARYSWDDITREGADPDGNDLQNTFKTFLPRVSLDYQLDEDTLFFALVSKGNQPGDFNTNPGVPADLVVVDEQDMWNYEVGFRRNFHEGRGLFAGGAYYIDWSDQVVSFNIDSAPGFPIPTVRASTNAGETEILGFELEGSYQWTDRLITRATYSYTNAEYKDFLSRIPLDYGGDPQVAGNRLQNTPNHQASFAYNYEREFSPNSDFSWFIGNTLSFKSSQFLDETNTAEIGSALVVDGQLGVANDNYRLSLIGRNIFSEDTPDFATRFLDFRTFLPAYQVALREPAYFGVRLDVNL